MLSCSPNLVLPPNAHPYCSGKGSAQVKSPQGGFDARDLEVLFRRTISITPRTPTRTAPALPDSSSANTQPSGPFSTPAKRAAVLAPSIIGGIVVLALVFYLIRRYRRNKTATNGEAVALTGGSSSDNPPGYKPRDSAAPEPTSGHPLSAYPTGNAPPPPQLWGYPPHQHPPAEYMNQYPTGHSYSEYSEPQTPARIQSPVELPHGQTPAPSDQSDYEGWRPPIQRGAMPEGHYPPPLPEGFVPGRSPEMKERRDRDGGL